MNMEMRRSISKHVEQGLLLQPLPHIYRQDAVRKLLELGFTLEDISQTAGIPMNDLNVFLKGSFSYFGGQFVGIESVQRLELLIEFLEINNYLE